MIKVLYATEWKTRETFPIAKLLKINLLFGCFIVNRKELNIQTETRSLPRKCINYYDNHRELHIDQNVKL